MFAMNYNSNLWDLQFSRSANADGETNFNHKDIWSLHEMTWNSKGDSHEAMTRLPHVDGAKTNTLKFAPWNFINNYENAP